MPEAPDTDATLKVTSFFDAAINAIIPIEECTKEQLLTTIQQMSAELDKAVRKYQRPQTKIAVLAGTAEQFRQWASKRDAKIYQAALRAEAEKWEAIFVNSFERMIGIRFDEIVLLYGFDPGLLDQLLVYDVWIRPRPKAESYSNTA